MQGKVKPEHRYMIPPRVWDRPETSSASSDAPARARAEPVLNPKLIRHTDDGTPISTQDEYTETIETEDVDWVR